MLRRDAGIRAGWHKLAPERNVNVVFATGKEEQETAIHLNAQQRSFRWWLPSEGQKIREYCAGHVRKPLGSQHTCNYGNQVQRSLARGRDQTSSGRTPGIAFGTMHRLR